MIESLRKLADELRFDFSLLESIVEIVVNDFNPAQPNKEQLGQLEVSIKKLFRKIVPNLNVEFFGKIIELVLLGDS